MRRSGRLVLRAALRRSVRGSVLALVLGGAGALAVRPARLAAQQPAGATVAVVRDLGPGEEGRLLRDALARPHRLIVRDTGTLHLPRDTTFATTLVVVGGDVTVASRVEGDVIVVGGDLYLRPGAHVRGRAMAFGGGVYNSTLATVDIGVVAFRDVTFDPRAAGTELALHYRALYVQPAPTLVWPGLYGVGVPTYNRVDGLALPFGPRVALLDGRVTLDPRLTYRSHLGVVDPRLSVAVAISRRSEVELVAERGTYTNDAWARADVVNALTALAYGDDERNYYRATLVGGVVKRRWESAGGFVEPWIGAQTEDARSVGPVRGTTSAPWSVWGGDDTTRMLRPNPAVNDGRITSLVAGAAGAWDTGDMQSRARLRLELPVKAPGDRGFTQITVDAATEFPTVLDHRLQLAAHAVATVGDTAPAQRFAYLGGGSTIPTVPELAMGGDQLVFVEGTYFVPLPRPNLPLVGPPTLGLRYLVGAAGIDGLPPLVQNVGISVAVSLLRLDVLVDPASGRRAIGFGVTLP